MTKDALLGGRVLLEQPAQGYRAAIDPILLAAAVQANSGERVLELGIGAGAASLCLLARLPQLHVTGLERDKDLVALARYNAELNKIGRQLTVIEETIANGLNLDGIFDQAIANPPYHDAARHPSDSAATHMAEEELATWVSFVLRHLKSRGTLTFIHRADGLGLILAALGDKAGAIKILPIASRTGDAANRIIISAVKDRKTPLRLLSPLILHEADGSFTREAEAILREGKALTL